MIQRTSSTWMVLFVAVFGLAACGGDSGETAGEAMAQTPAAETPAENPCAAANPSGDSNGPSAYQPIDLAIAAKSGAGSSRSMPMCARSTGVPRRFAIGLVPLLTDDDHRLAAKLSKPADDGGVISICPVAAKLHEAGEQAGHIVR